MGRPSAILGRKLIERGLRVIKLCVDQPVCMRQECAER